MILSRFTSSVIIIYALAVTPCLAAVSGNVTDTVGSPVAGVLVTFISENNPINIFSVLTDYNGNYEFSLDTISPPSNVIISDDPNDNGHKLHLSWTLSPDDELISYYNIYRSRNPELTNPIGLETFNTLEEIIDNEEKMTILIAQIPKGQTSFTDSSVPLSNTIYYYWIAAVSETGVSEKVSAGYLTAVNEQTNDTSNHVSLTLYQNFPNPFNPITSVPFNLRNSGFIDLSIYNILGQKVRTLINGYYSAGSHTVIWNARNDSGENVGAGIYIFQLRHESQIESNKMLLLDGGIARANYGLTNSFYHNNKEQHATLPNVYKSVLLTHNKITEDITYHVIITGENIDTFEERGVTIADGNAYYFRVIRLTYGINNVTFVNIPGGTFQMGGVGGGSYSWEKPVHTVTVSPFEMSTMEITNAQYEVFLNEALASGGINEPSGGSVTGKTGDYSGQEYIYLSGTNSDYPQNECWIRYYNGTFSVESGYENWPVVWVTWYGAKVYALYYGLDLPREAEWEYAARGGKQYKYGTNDGTISTSKANYWATGINNPLEVGSYIANPFGLKDMSGNVWEWCNDWYDGYNSDSVTDPTGPQTGYNRVLRGGSWGYDVLLCRAAYRGDRAPGSKNSYLGFRVVRR